MIVVPEMPVYWRYKNVSGNRPEDPPARVSFGFDYDADLNLFVEKRSESLTDLLNDIYSRNSNVGFLQDGHGLVNTYGADFWHFFEAFLEEYPVKNILEVGCGGCLMLERLSSLGYQVLGIDPSPFAAESGAKKNIKVIQEFFPPKSMDFEPNLIFQVDVLEHIEDPVGFLKSQADCLEDGGMIVVNVPDCTDSLERGDISMALHQHVNMFDTDSLPVVFRAAGLEVLKLERSQYGSALYCAARKTKSPVDDYRSDENKDRLVRFESQAKANIERFTSRIEEVLDTGQSFGFFMPQRAFPYLGTMNLFEGYRVFDNNNMWHQKYLDGLETPVENQKDLIENPVDHVFVMSLTFGEEVASQLKREVPNMQITTLENILSPKS